MQLQLLTDRENGSMGLKVATTAMLDFTEHPEVTGILFFYAINSNHGIVGIEKAPFPFPFKASLLLRISYYVLRQKMLTSSQSVGISW